MGRRKARRGHESASLCGQSAPGIAHMWHMPGHTYHQAQTLRRRRLAAGSLGPRRSRYMMRDRILPDQIHNYAHNNEWLVAT